MSYMQLFFAWLTLACQLWIVITLLNDIRKILKSNRHD
jgi:hypothetical protein